MYLFTLMVDDELGVFALQILKQSCTEILTVEPSSVCVNRESLESSYFYCCARVFMCACMTTLWGHIAGVFLIMFSSG